MYPDFARAHVINDFILPQSDTSGQRTQQLTPFRVKILQLNIPIRDRIEEGVTEGLVTE